MRTNWPVYSRLTRSFAVCAAARPPRLARLAWASPAFAAPLNSTQQKLAGAMRAAWANFAVHGNPTTSAVHWPTVSDRIRAISLVSPLPHIDRRYSVEHHCAFWTAG